MTRWLTVIFLLGVFTGFAQNLDKIGQEDMVKVSGGVNSNFVVNHTVNEPQFRDPFSWVFSGNVTVNFLEVSLPFTFSFSNAGKSYSQPFNMTAIHPTYKNWKAHIGITSMSFSPYTYQGLNFTGAGLEYTPQKWHIKAFGGRLKNAVEYDVAENNLTTVSYSRMGFGFGAAYKAKAWNTELLLLKAYDDPTSLSLYHHNSELTAKDNVVASLKGSFSILKHLRVNGEFASSILTQNILADDPSFTPNKWYRPVIKSNPSTVVSNAYNTSLDYRYKTFGLGLKYERIDPQYSTLGAVYFNNDIENITINPSFSVFKNKLSIALSTGYQRNNLNAKNVSDAKRWIGTANLTAQLIKGMSVNASYSNMSSFTKTNPAADPFYNSFGDTLNYYQIAESFSSSISYAFGDKIQQAISLTGGYAKSQNITGRLDDAAAFGLNVNTTQSDLPVDVYNGVLSHTFQLSKHGMSLGWMINANHTIAMGATNSFLGPGINASKAILQKKMNLNVGSNYNQQYTQQELSNHVVNVRMGLRYNPKFKNQKVGRLSLSLNGNWTNKFAVITSTPNSQNITLIANISHQF